MDIETFLDRQPFNGRQIALVGACAVAALLDGMDLQSIGLAAPAIAGTLHIAPQSFGAIFSAALAGLALGAFCLGPLADRFGSRKILVATVFFFGTFSLLTAFARTYPQLFACRLLTGFGLGGAMPCFISLASEYVPRRLRATTLAILWAGFPLGGVVGGLVAAQLLATAGWPAIFLAEGGLTVAFAPLLMALPPSLSHLMRTSWSGGLVVRALRRIFPEVLLPEETLFVPSRKEAEKSSIGALFSGGQWFWTLLLWGSFFFAFMILVVNSTWSPLLLQSIGIPVGASALAMVAFNFGSLFGSAGAGWLLSRYGARLALGVSFAGSAAIFAAMGVLAPQIGRLVLSQGAFGALIGCASSGLIAFSAICYPPSARSTGVGWAMAVGRIGSFCGPLFVAALVGRHWPAVQIFLAVGCMILIGVVCTFVQAGTEKATGYGG